MGDREQTYFYQQQADQLKEKRNRQTDKPMEKRNKPKDKKTDELRKNEQISQIIIQPTSLRQQQIRTDLNSNKNTLHAVLDERGDKLNIAKKYQISRLKQNDKIVESHLFFFRNFKRLANSQPMNY